MDDLSPLPVALVAQAKQLLEQQGHTEAAVVLDELRLLIEQPKEVWQIGGSDRTAHRLIVVAPSRWLVLLRKRPELKEQIRSALASAFDSPERILRDILVILDSSPHLQADLAPHPYRSIPDPACPPNPATAGRAIAGYLRALKQDDSAKIAERSHITYTTLAPKTPEARPSYRIEFRVDISDLASATQHPSIRSQLVDATRTLLTNPYWIVGEVTLQPNLDEMDQAPKSSSARQTAIALQSWLLSEGISAAILGETSDSVRLVASLGSKLGIIDVGEHPWSEGTLQIASLQMDKNEHDLAEMARVIRESLKKK